MGSKKTFAVLGANNHASDGHAYAEDSFYATHVDTVKKLLHALNRDSVTLNNNIWECACGSGTIASVLEENGYNVFCSDIVDRGWPNTEIRDFLGFENYNMKFDGDILTNPPYKFSLEFVKKALECIDDGNKVIMLLKVQFLEGKERRIFYRDNPPKYVYVHSERQACYINGDFSEVKGSAVCYCWYIWEKGFKGEPVIRWVED